MKIILFLLLRFFCVNTLLAEEGFETRNIAINLDTPWEIHWGPDNFIWMTERYGRISRVNPETGEVIELARLTDVFEDGERGLMGMVLHPDFTQNPYVYTVFTYKDSKGETLIKTIRLTYDGTKLANPITLIDSIQGAWNHDGSRLFIDKDMTLYMTMGDAATSALAQNMNSKNGKILRMNLDGAIPSNNPFPNSYVWTSGHRNPQGLIKANGIMYSSEHGVGTDDELNIIEKGRNYGWPQVEGFCNTPNEKTFCSANNVVEPIAAWTPTLAVAGIDYYENENIPEWNHSILMVVLKSSRLVQIKLSENGMSVVEQNHFFADKFGRLRDICISPQGRIFISTSNKDGRGSPTTIDDRIIEIIPISTDIKEEKALELEITPNPVNDKIHLNLPGTGLKEIEIINSNGFSIFQTSTTENRITINTNVLDINTSNSGLYFLKLRNNSKIFISKFVILK